MGLKFPQVLETVFLHLSNGRVYSPRQKPYWLGDEDFCENCPGVKETELFMVSKCANPECSAPFRYFRQGKVFEIRYDSSHFHVTAETGSRKNSKEIEHYWLCPKCALKMTIAVNRKREILVMPLALKVRGAAA